MINLTIKEGILIILVYLYNSLYCKFSVDQYLLQIIQIFVMKCHLLFYSYKKKI